MILSVVALQYLIRNLRKMMSQEVMRAGNYRVGNGEKLVNFVVVDSSRRPQIFRQNYMH
jgi:hypothetical protein